MKTFAVAAFSLLLMGAAVQPADSVETRQESFVVKLPNGKSFRITPNPAELKEIASFVFQPESTSPIQKQFERLVTRAVSREATRNPNLNVARVVFAQVTGRHGSGESFRPWKFRIGDYAKIEELRRQ